MNLNASLFLVHLRLTFVRISLLTLAGISLAINITEALCFLTPCHYKSLHSLPKSVVHVIMLLTQG